MPERARPNLIFSPEPETLILIACGMADGQIHQADVILARPRKQHRLRGLPRALEHMRSACGWLRSAAEVTSTREGTVI